MELEFPLWFYIVKEAKSLIHLDGHSLWPLVPNFRKPLVELSNSCNTKVYPREIQGDLELSLVT